MRAGTERERVDQTAQPGTEITKEVGLETEIRVGLLIFGDLELCAWSSGGVGLEKAEIFVIGAQARQDSRGVGNEVCGLKNFPVDVTLADAHQIASLANGPAPHNVF